MIGSVAAVANPDELAAKARQLRSEANALDPLGRSARGSNWEGTAAAQFRSDLGTDQRAVTTCANDLRSAASAMDAGAKQVRRYHALPSGSEREIKLSSAS